MAKIKLMLADHHTVVREGLKALLDRKADIKVAAEAEDNDEMWEKLKDIKPDVLIIDVFLPNLAGIEFIGQIREISENTKVVILTMYQKQDDIRQVLHAGAKGYLLKTSPFEEVMGAIRSAYRNKYFLSAEINADIIHSYLEKKTEQPHLNSYEQLTRREQQIFKMLAEGATANEIGGRLSISPKTVAKHRTNLMEKLNMKNTSSLVRYAIELGVIDPNKTDSSNL
ncbi:MAG: response regulator transcription factor [Desulfobacteraceae bacterium]|nr:response regulator transcription factor [Desulfobacteraceae bacterium]MCF8093833.1 response regulator transcription factor [Desulfobacteraceae bacterium]